jgi:hypothetical protein
MNARAASLALMVVTIRLSKSSPPLIVLTSKKTLAFGRI